MGGCTPKNCNQSKSFDFDPTDEIGTQRFKQTTSTRKPKQIKAGEKSVNEDEELAFDFPTGKVIEDQKTRPMGKKEKKRLKLEKMKGSIKFD